MEYQSVRENARKIEKEMITSRKNMTSDNDNPVGKKPILIEYIMNTTTPAPVRER